MLKNLSFLRLAVFTFNFWLIISFLFGKFEAKGDAYNEIGLPLAIYRSPSYKCFNWLDVGFMAGNFFFDAGCVLLVAFIFKATTPKIKAYQRDGMSLMR